MDLDATGILASPAVPPEKGDQPMSRSRRRNGGLRKRCGCPRKVWPKCSHSWHMNYKPRGGPHYRISLDREAGKHLESKSDAETVAARVRVAIDDGKFRQVDPAPVAEIVSAPIDTLETYARGWLRTEQRHSISRRARCASTRTTLRITCSHCSGRDRSPRSRARTAGS